MYKKCVQHVEINQQKSVQIRPQTPQDARQIEWFDRLSRFIHLLAHSATQPAAQLLHKVFRQNTSDGYDLYPISTRPTMTTTIY